VQHLLLHIATIVIKRNDIELFLIDIKHQLAVARKRHLLLRPKFITLTRPCTTIREHPVNCCDTDGRYTSIAPALTRVTSLTNHDPTHHVLVTKQACFVKDNKCPASEFEPGPHTCTVSQTQDLAVDSIILVTITNLSGQTSNGYNKSGVPTARPRHIIIRGNMPSLVRHTVIAHCRINC
jgi:hypothetical protein